MKKILIPTDFTKDSDQVIKLALDAFKKEPSIFYLLDTYSLDIYGLDAFSLLHDSELPFIKHRQDSFRRMSSQINRCVTRNSNSKHFFHLLSENSDLITGIKKAVENNSIDIVLIGTKGKDQKTGKYLEKSINQILKSVTNCSVISVPLNGIDVSKFVLEMNKSIKI